MPAGKEVQPECISQRASSGRLNCSCSRSRDLTAINPVVPEMMKIAALAVSTAPGGNMSFAFSKSVPIAPAKGRGKRTPAWTNRRAKALVPCGFADAKTAKGILQYQNSRKRLSNCPRIPREEVRKYGSFQSGAKYGITDIEAKLDAMSVGGLLGLWFQSLFVGLTMKALSICIMLVVYGRMIEIYLVTSIAPIPVATMVNREWGGMGQNYLKSLLALGFQAFLILVCVGIYAVLIQTIAATDDISGAIWSCIRKSSA